MKVHGHPPEAAAWLRGIPAIHRCFDALGDPGFHGLHGTVAGVNHGGAFTGGETAEHIILHVPAGGDVPHAEAQAGELLAAQALDNMRQPVMPAGTALRAQANLAGWQVRYRRR